MARTRRLPHRELSRVLDDERVDGERNTDCGHYDECLDSASRRHWESFSCRGCGDYERAPIGGVLIPLSTRVDSGFGLRLRKAVSA